jgi:hypothetical protein
MIDKANTNFINKSKQRKSGADQKKPERPDAVPVVASKSCCA